MDRRYFPPIELLSTANQHAYCADYLLRHVALGELQRGEGQDVLAPVVSLMYQAFQLIFRAYCLHDHRPVKEYKNLVELMELNSHLGLSSQEITLLKTLSRQYAFHKGVDNELWENQQQLHVFCAKVVSLYERVLSMMPLELQDDYSF
jgi:hypothetical protein